MQLFGLTLTRTKLAPVGFQSIERSRGWWPLVSEGFRGAWQRNIVLSREDILTYAAVYACVTLIASDIGKLRIKLVEQDAEGIWTETENSAYSPVLRKPNRYQTRIKFIEQWIASKLIHGNTYVLKERDARGVVSALYVLDAQRVRVLVAPDGSVYYSLSTDNLAGLQTSVVVPAREIIHDVMTPLYHPLCGVSPLSACGLAASQGIRVQKQSTLFFENGSTPSGTLTMPDPIDSDQAKEIQDRWDSAFTGNNFGKVAVLGFGLKYEPMTMSAVDSQLIEQLRWTAENVCTAHHVPPYMIGVGPPPNYNNIEALNQQYYSQCLQNPIESLELLLDEGLELKKPYGTELDLDDLLRMDTSTRVKAAREAIQAGMSPNEARKQYFGLRSVKGGETPYLQEQNWPLAQLATRETPTRTPTEPAPLPPAPESELKAISSATDEAQQFASSLILKVAAIARRNAVQVSNAA